MSNSIHITIADKCSLIVLSPQRSCQKVKVVLCQLSATCVASAGIEGEVGHEVVGYGIADELSGDMVEVGNEEVSLGFLLVVHRIVGIANVLGAIHDGAELAFVEAGDEEDDVLHSSGKGSLATFRHLQFFVIEGLVGFVEDVIEVFVRIVP